MSESLAASEGVNHVLGAREEERPRSALVRMSSRPPAVTELEKPRFAFATSVFDATPFLEVASLTSRGAELCCQATLMSFGVYRDTVVQMKEFVEATRRAGSIPARTHAWPELPARVVRSLPPAPVEPLALPAALASEEPPSRAPVDAPAAAPALAHVLASALEATLPDPDTSRAAPLDEDAPVSAITPSESLPGSATSASTQATKRNRKARRNRR